MASNHFINSQGQQQSGHPPGSHPFGSTAHPFSAPAPYLSSMGLLPSGASTAEPSLPFSASAHGHHSQLGHLGHPPNGQGGSLHMPMPSGMSTPLLQHTTSVRPSIVKRARNNGRSRPLSRAASAMDDAGAVMFAAQHAAAAAASHHSNPLHSNRFLQQMAPQTVQHHQQQSQHLLHHQSQQQQEPQHHHHQQPQQQHHQPQQHQQLHQHQRMLDHNQMSQRHATTLPYSQHQQETHQQEHHHLDHQQLSHHQSTQQLSHHQSTQQQQHMLHSNQQQHIVRHVSQSQPNMMAGTPPLVSTGPVYECDGIQFKMVEELPDVKVKRLKSEKIKPIEELTFEDIKAYNRNQLRAYCFVYGIKRKKKAEMEQNMARYAAMFHPGDPVFDLSKFVPTDYLPGPIPRRKVPVTKEQKALSAGKFAARLMSAIARPNASGQQAFAAPASLPTAHYGLSHSTPPPPQQQQQVHAQQHFQQLHTQQMHHPKLQFGSRSQHDPLAGFHNGSGMMVSQHLLGDMGEE